MPRVVTLEELCNEPVGAIFSAYEPCIVSGLYRRGRVLLNGLALAKPGNYAHDFFYHTLLAAPDLNGPHQPDDKQQAFCNINAGGRWGNLDPTELFVLYSPDDLAAMVQFLTGEATVEGETDS